VEGELSAFAPWYSATYLQGPAPILSLRPPEIALLRETHDSGVRTLHLRVTSPRGAPEIVISAPLDQAASAKVDGKNLGDPHEARRNAREWMLNYSNLPAEGIELELTLKTAGALEVTAIDHLSRGLPASGRAGTAHSGDQTLVRRDFVF
jgi:hypothetical protein